MTDNDLNHTIADAEESAIRAAAVVMAAIEGLRSLGIAGQLMFLGFLQRELLRLLEEDRGGPWQS